jgi:hypothetical protein
MHSEVKQYFGQRGRGGEGAGVVVASVGGIIEVENIDASEI